MTEGSTMIQNRAGESRNLSTTIVATTALISSSVTALISYCYYRRKLVNHDELQKTLDQCQECRKGERQGRIRAEIKLRETVTKLQILERTKNNQKEAHTNGTVEAKESVVTDIDNTSTPSSEMNEADEHHNKKPLSKNEDEKFKLLQNQNNRSTLTEEDDTLLVSSKQQQTMSKIMQTIKPRTFQLKEIGRIVSPFVKRMGTPRQGILAPHSMGYVEFFKDVPSTSLSDGIEEYSHLWILFEFHANTNLHKTHQQRSTKVRPPRAPLGTKVGQLATRSPHRPNALGLSLVQFHKYDPMTRRLYVNALDLVHGTPVYDIKPYVPWDDPRTAYQIFGHDKVDLSSWAQIRVPFWVDQQDTIPIVSWSDEALMLLKEYVIQQNCLAPLYDSSIKSTTGSSNDDDNFHESLLKNVKQAIDEIVQQDPRASHTRNASTSTPSDDTNQGSSSAYRILFGTLEIEFDVVDTIPNEKTKTTNAAEQKVVKVMGIKYVSDISLGFGEDNNYETVNSAVSLTRTQQQRRNNSTTKTNYYKSKAEGIPIMGL